MPLQTGTESLCPICGQTTPSSELFAAKSVRDPIAIEIRVDHPEWGGDEQICAECLNHYRAAHVRRLLQTEKGELSALEEEVVRSFREQAAIAENINEQFDQELRFGERMSDQIASFGGSWMFLGLFFLFLVGWMAINTVILAQHRFDPFPFILLNLLLSCLAAVQAPIILMSQNRQDAKDRLRSENDYRVDLKAELEVRLLHAKLDQLLTHQWQRLLEIQELQVELINEVAGQRSRNCSLPNQPGA